MYVKKQENIFLLQYSVVFYEHFSHFNIGYFRNLAPLLRSK